MKRPEDERIHGSCGTFDFSSTFSKLDGIVQHHYSTRLEHSWLMLVKHQL